MNPTPLLDPLDITLRTLDAADADLTPARRAHADAVLERILATDPSAAVGDEHAWSTPSARPWWRRRLVLLPTAAAALAAGLVFAPGLGGAAPAYASWTATPTAADDTDVAQVTAACRDRLAELGSAGGQPAVVDPAGARVLVAERRGDWVAVLFRGAGQGGQMTASCLARDPVGSDAAPTDVQLGVAGSDGQATTPGPGKLLEGSTSQLGDPPLSFTDGAVGPDVVGVCIHAGDKVVTATVKDGRYVAWWPGQAFDDAARPPSGQGGPPDLLTYDLTLADGTVVPGAVPWWPSGSPTSASAGSGSASA